MDFGDAFALFCTVFTFVILGVVIWFSFFTSKQIKATTNMLTESKTRADELRPQYQAAIAELKAVPNRENRIKVLEIGREYAKACAIGNSAEFNEAALQADLSVYGVEE